MTKGRGVGLLAVLIGCLAAAGGAAAAQPVATTGAVTAFGTASATVGGTVNPNGEATTWYVEYGRSTSYGSRTSTTSAGAGTSPASVSATLADLAPATTYHYRLVAANASGMARGADGLLTTAAAPSPVAATGAATEITSTGATLNGTVNPNGLAATWYFEYGTGTGYGSRTPAQNAGAGTSATAVAAPVTGLSGGRVYHFRLVATSDAGTSRGDDRTFTPGGPPTATTAAASSVASTAARLNGEVNPGGADTTWRFEYGTSTAYGSSTPARSAGSGTRSTSVSASLSRLTAGTTYHFRLLATNGSGTSAGADQAFTTVAAPAAPAAQTGGAQAVATTTATLTGSVDPRGLTTSWYFEYGTSTRYGSRTSTQRTDSGTGSRGVTAAVSRLAPGQTYHFRLVATSSAGTARGADASFATVGASVTLARSAPLVVYGRGVTLNGTASGGSGVEVAVLAQPFGEGTFRRLATVRTDGSGRWTFLARPSIATAYQASASGATSGPVTVAVRPAVSLHVVRGGRLSTHVAAGKSFAGRFVQLQRRSSGRWVTVRRVRLNARSSATIGARALPHGRSTIRVAMSVNQAGPGYLAGFSRVLGYRRG